MKSGILVVDKAAGSTSFDVVVLARRVLRVRRVGHGGTLDPAAVGVLPILIGEATKLTPYLTEQDKEYRVTIRLGVTTDTHDLTGRVVAESAVPPLTTAMVATAARAFVGRIRQVPPMYSAVHHGGRRLYELARAGREVPRAAREVTVHAITVESVTPPTATLLVVCGKGTYVRVLVAELGAALGVGAAVERLVRTRVGPFGLADALPSAQLTAAAPDTVWARVRPPEAALQAWPHVRLDAEAAAAFVHGQAVAVAIAAGSRHVAVHGPDGRLLGVGEALPAGGWIKPSRILHADDSGPRVVPA